MMKDLEKIVLGVDSETGVIQRKIQGVANDLQNIVENVLQVIQIIHNIKSLRTLVIRQMAM